ERPSRPATQIDSQLCLFVHAVRVERGHVEAAASCGVDLGDLKHESHLGLDAVLASDVAHINDVNTDGRVHSCGTRVELSFWVAKERHLNLSFITLGKLSLMGVEIAPTTTRHVARASRSSSRSPISG